LVKGVGIFQRWHVDLRLWQGPGIRTKKSRPPFDMRKFAGGDGDARQGMLGADFSAPLLKGADANSRFGRLPKTRKTMQPAFANVWTSAPI
jgi:hypothetical protein